MNKNEMQIFQSEEFGKVRIITIDDEPWFVGKDVAEALGYERTADAIRQHVESEDKGVGKIQTPGGIQSMTIINESGMYALIFESKLESAKRFKHWVTSEILPSIRKHGGYIAGQETMTDEELLSRALLVADSKIKERDRIIARQSAEIEEMKPKVSYLDVILQNKSLVNTTTIAKDYGMTA